MLVINNTKNTVSSWGLVLKPGERKKIYGIVSRKAIKCSSLSFYPDDADEVGMIRYNYPGRKIIMSNQYNVINKPIEKSVVKTEVKKEVSEKIETKAVFPELPEPRVITNQEVGLIKLEVINNPPPSPPPKKRRGRRPKVTLLITEVDLEKARLEALKLDAKLEAEELLLLNNEN